MTLDVDSCNRLGALAAGLGLGLGGLALLALLVPLRRAAGRPLRRWLVLLGVGLLFLAAGATGTFAAGSCAPAPPKCATVLAAGRTNLLANPSFAPGGPGTPPANWTVNGSLAGGAPAGWAMPAAGSDLQATRVPVVPGAHLCFAVETAGSGHVQVLLRWQDAAKLRDRLADTAPAPQAAGQTVRGEGVAPAGAAYAWLWLRALDGAPRFHAPALAGAGARAELPPGGAAAALAFSFDWETAMGGLIHSKSGHDRAYAVARGLNMRLGTQILLGLFQQQRIQATFYATGYNLLDGNPTRRQFAGNPTYKWAQVQGWNTTWWLTHPWYSDDPYGTVASDPAWYFGDQADRLRAAGQEIGSHTFGHLAVRNTRPISLSVDLDTWAAAAAARGLPPARSFAFPWESSNSLTPDFYRVLAAHGFDSVTRVYSTDLVDDYLINAPTADPVMPIMPDILLGVAGQNSVEGNLAQAPDAAAGRAVLAELIARRGVTSFWNHPEVLTIPSVQSTWREVVAAAATARDRGDLWIAPVSTIVQRRRDVAQVQVTTAENSSRIVVAVANRSPDALDGLTITLPRPAATVRIGGQAAPQRRPEQVVIPHLAAGAQVEIDATAAGAGPRP